jgi:hypothetical protein
MEKECFGSAYSSAMIALTSTIEALPQSVAITTRRSTSISYLYGMYRVSNVPGAHRKAARGVA